MDRMKAKLIKKDGHYFLEVEPNTWTPPNRFHSIIANTLDKKEGDVLQLSLKNCQAIERGWDLDEYIAFELQAYIAKKHNQERCVGFIDGYEVGFQKALELMGDKKFSVEDLAKAYAVGYGDFEHVKNSWKTLIQSLQQTEWDVEIEMEYHPTFQIVKLDADGCLILTFKSE